MVLVTHPESADVVLPAAREHLQGLLAGAPASLGPRDPLNYPLRAARRFLNGETYGPARFFALERAFLRRESYLKGYKDALSFSADDAPPDTVSGGERTLPSPPVTHSASRPPTFEECRDMIERTAEQAVPLPEFLAFVDLVRGQGREVREKNVATAAKAIDLPMQTVLDRIFSRAFHISENRGDFPDYWAENINLTASRTQPEKPSVRIVCDLASTSEGQAFILALHALLNITTYPI